MCDAILLFIRDANSTRLFIKTCVKHAPACLKHAPRMLQVCGKHASNVRRKCATYASSMPESCVKPASSPHQARIKRASSAHGKRAMTAATLPGVDQKRRWVSFPRRTTSGVVFTVGQTLAWTPSGKTSVPEIKRFSLFPHALKVLNFAPGTFTKKKKIGEARRTYSILYTYPLYI